MSTISETVKKIEIKNPLNVNNNSQKPIPFKSLSAEQFHLKKDTFDYLIKQVFIHLKDPNSKYYLGDNQWLALTFESIFTKNPTLLLPIHKHINDFYKIYPFDIENIFTKVVSDFLKQYTFKETVTGNNNNLKIFKEKGLEKIAIDVFFPDFLEYIKTNMILNNSKYKSFKKLFQTLLRNKIKNIIKSEDKIVNWDDYPNLDKWIKEFDYKSSKLLNIQNIYNDCFSNKNNLQKINFTETDFVENYLTEFLNENLDYKDRNLNYSHNEQIQFKEWTLMWQTFLYYIFWDLIQTKKIKPVKIWSLKKAIKFYKTFLIYKNSKDYYDVILDLFPDLRKIKYNFFPLFEYKIFDNDGSFRTKKMLNKKNNFGIKLEAKWAYAESMKYEKIHNLDYHFPLEPHILLIKLKFVALTIPSSKKSTSFNFFGSTFPKNIFKIKIVKNETSFKKVKKQVDQFIKDNPISFPKKYSFNSSSMTEKDLVKKTSFWKGINDIEWEFLSSNSSGQEIKYKKSFISFDDLNNSFSINLKQINNQLALLNNSHFNFKLEAQLVIYRFNHIWTTNLKKRNNYEYFYKINLLLIQEAKNNNFPSLWKKYKISLQYSYDFDIGFTKKYNFPFPFPIPIYRDLPYQKLLFIINVIKESLKKEKSFQKIDLKLKPKPWDDQKRSFWLEEFLEKDGYTIRTKNSYAQKILDQHSNVSAIKKYLEPLIAQIKNYRDDIIFEYKSIIIHYSQTKERIIELDFIIKDKLTLQTLTFRTQRRLMSLEKYHNNPIFDFLRFSKPISPFNNDQQKKGSKISENFTFSYKNEKMTISDMIKKLESHGFKNVKYSSVLSVLYDKSKNNLPYINFSFDVPYYNFASKQERLKNIIIKVYLKDHNFIVTSTEIESRYKDILSSLSPLQRKNKNFMDNINKLFAKLKDPITNKWKDDITRDNFINNISKIESSISKYQEKNVLEIIGRLRKIYGDDIPKEILDKALDPSYYKILKEILDQRKHIGDKNIRKILENNKFVNFLKKQKISKVRSFILDFLKVTEKTKYAYFGMGIGFGLAGLLSIGATGWQMKANAKSRKINVKFRRNKYLSIMTLSSALITIAASTVFMFLFFITKGGF